MPNNSEESNNPFSPDVPISTLESVLDQFIAWRKSRKRGARIPDSLWSQALSLSDTYSVGQITSRLGLGWESFHKRLCQKQGAVYDAKKKSKCHESSSAASFVELKVSEMGFGHPSPSPCLLELCSPSGSVLRLYASALSCANINLNSLIDKFFLSRD